MAILVSLSKEMMHEDIARLIDGWTVDVTLIDPEKSFTMYDTFRGVYVSHDADYICFDVFDKRTGKKAIQEANSIGYGWELIKHIELVGFGRVCDATELEKIKTANPSRKKK